MNRNDFILLAILNAKEAVDSMSGLAIRDIYDEDIGIKMNTYQKKLTRLRKNGYVNIGFRDGHANTYYITKKGIKTLESHKKGSV